MLDLPPRERLARLAGTIREVVPAVAFGFARSLDEDRVSILLSYPHGIAGYELKASNVPEVFSPSTDNRAPADLTITSQATGPVEWLLQTDGVQCIVSVPIPGCVPAARFWMGMTDHVPLTPDQHRRLEATAEASSQVLNIAASSDEPIDTVRRLHLAGDLLPALLRVLDVRAVFDRLSQIARQALPHDVLLLGLLNAELSEITIFARSDGGSNIGSVVPYNYPPDVTRTWQFDIVDDLARHPFEMHRAARALGARSSLRLPIRFDNRTIGGLGFLSFEPGRYDTSDVAVGRRLADHVAVALSHHDLAQQLAEQARRHAALQAQTTHLELLDEFLSALVDSAGLSDAFPRISAIAQKVLPHDAASLMVRMPDLRHARVYAMTGFGESLPAVTELPDELIENPDWEHDIFNDLSLLAGENYARLRSLGFQSLLRVPIRLDGRFAGALMFVSKAPAAFTTASVPVARRMADRMAIPLARDRELEASRRADEATERAAKLEARVRALTDELDARTGYRRVVGESKELRQVLTQAAQVAVTDTTVLLLGESGTGKEVVARFVHRGSPRKNGPFIALNCAALPEQLLEAELFGYERGAYTGATQSKPGQLEQAAGGTLFLDEVAEMSPAAQAKFLRVLQEREFQRLGGTRVLRTDARIVAATNRDLLRAIANGQFREDLYYRLNVFAIRLPPLRDRRDDILPLGEAFVAEIGRGLGRPPAGVSRDARQLLIEYHWPGNVRELRNILERAAILCDGGLITSEHLALTPLRPAVAAPSSAHAPVSVDAGRVALPSAAPSPAGVAPAGTADSPAPSGDLQTMERAMIEQALQNARFNKSKAAKTLGLTRHQLYIRMRKYGFE